MINEIIKLIDFELEKSGKSYMSVQKANRIINESGLNIDNTHNLTAQLIKDEKIPHAFKFPKSNNWSIPHSNPEKVKKTKYRRCSECLQFYPLTKDLKLETPFWGGTHYIFCPYCKRKTEVPYNLLDNIPNEIELSNSEIENGSEPNSKGELVSENKDNPIKIWGIIFITAFLIFVGFIIANEIKTQKSQSESKSSIPATSKIQETKEELSEEKKYIDQDFQEIKPHKNKTIIGKWLDHDALNSGTDWDTSCEIILYKAEGKFFLEQKFDDGSLIVEMKTKVVSGKTRYFEEGNAFQEYYIINNQGNLEIYDFQGHIMTLPKVR